MKKSCMKITTKVLLLCSLLCINPIKARNNGPNGLVVAGGLVVGTGLLYIAGRAGSALVYTLAQRRYEPEMELLQRMMYKPSVLEEELVPYVLRLHAQANDSFFFYPGVYKNYPLLHYKQALDDYINYLWYLQLFRLGTDKRREISTFIDKLKIVRDYIITDYRYIKEQRQFDERKA